MSTVVYQGCVENGPAAVPRLRDRLRIALDMRPPRALPAAHFDRNESYAYFGDRTLAPRLRGGMPPTYDSMR